MRIGKKRIGLDLDCVLNDMNRKLVNLYNYYTDEHLHITDIKQWDFYKIEAIKYKGLFLDLLKRDSFWKTLEPLKDSQYYTKLLCKEYEIFIITSTYPQNIKIKVDWLQEHFPHIEQENIIITYNKQMIDVDLLADDYEVNLIGGSYNKVLLDYPWNKNVNDKEHGIVRVHDWKGIYNAIHMLLPIK